MRILFSTFLFLISSFFLFYGFNYTFWGDNRPGPGFFPIILGVLLTLLTAVNLIMEVRKSRLEKNSTYDDEDFAFKDMVTVSIMILIYMIVFPYAGYLISTGLFIIGTLSYLNKGKWIQNISILIVVLVVIYFMFDYFLNTGLPSGILEI